MRWDERIGLGVALVLCASLFTWMGVAADQAAPIAADYYVPATGDESSGSAPDEDTGWSTLDYPVGHLEPYRLQSGVVANRSREAAVVYEELVYVEDAAWIRLYFERVDLGPGSTIRMTSVADGEVQELDAAGIAMWSNTSAYFNGDTVIVELVAGPETARNEVALDRVAVQIAPAGRGPCAADDCGICGSDDRVPSNELWSCRIVPVGCSGAVYNTQSCVVSAGHCAGAWNHVVQFNVPDSNPDCSYNHPPVADQFPVTAHQYNNGGPGFDWAVMKTGTNNLGQTAFQRYGEYRPIRQFAVSAGSSAEVWGYGADNGDPTLSGTQQYSSGSVVARFSTYYTINADVTYGNSGSGLIHNNEIIGIVTHCTVTCQNVCTRVDLGAFVEAREALCPEDAGYCEAGSSSTSYEHITNVTVGDIDHSSGSSGYADYTYISTNMEAGESYPITVTLYSQWSSDIGGLWIDWNNDGDFDDDGETITTAWTGTGPYEAVITVPPGTPTGSKRMRVRVQDGAYDPTLSPCGITSYGEVEDYTINVIVFVDTQPPTPNPLQFLFLPHPLSTSEISMTAVTAVDDTPPVTYQFNFTGGGMGGVGTNWQESTTYVNTGLVPNENYSYRVRARDYAPIPNVGQYSTVSTTATHIETPTGVGFGPVTSDSIELAAGGTLSRLTTGSSGVYFDSTTPGVGGINEWIQSPTDVATDLSPDTLYTFRVKARNRNAIETEYSPSSSKTTLAAVPAAPLLSNPTTSTLDLDVAPGSNPSWTLFAIRCTATDPADPSWEGRHVSTLGEPVAFAAWQTADDWGALTVSGLQPATAYTFAVKARNQDFVETDFGPEATASTTESPFAPGDLNCDGLINAFDIDPFVLALTDPAAYAAQYPDCDYMLADINGDGLVNAFDIDPFVVLLTGGGR
jgi:hypothetical protein